MEREREAEGEDAWVHLETSSVSTGGIEGALGFLFHL